MKSASPQRRDFITLLGGGGVAARGARAAAGPSAKDDVAGS
jgi:hypothetical protein